MKKLVWILLFSMLLTGCGAVQTFETLGQVQHEADGQAQPRQILLELPADAALETANTEESLTAYSCESYLLELQYLPGGDLAQTVETLTGFSVDRLTVLESSCDDHTRYDFTWTAASADGEVVCRAAVLSDGQYHYSLCAVALSRDAARVQAQWNELFSSFCLGTTV